jgi:hypothetical protein
VSQNKPINPPVNPSAEAIDIEKEMKLLQLEQLRLDIEEKRRTEAKYAEEYAQKRMLQLQQLASLKEARMMKDAEQDNCDHRDEKGFSRTRGNRSAGGRLTVICQKCQKEWVDIGDGTPRAIWGASKGQPIPTHLRPQSHHVGGFVSG